MVKKIIIVSFFLLLFFPLYSQTPKGPAPKPATSCLDTVVQSFSQMCWSEEIHLNDYANPKVGWTYKVDGAFLTGDFLSSMQVGVGSHDVICYFKGQRWDMFTFTVANPLSRGNRLGVVHCLSDDTLKFDAKLVSWIADVDSFKITGSGFVNNGIYLGNLTPGYTKCTVSWIDRKERCHISVLDSFQVVQSLLGTITLTPNKTSVCPGEKLSFRHSQTGGVWKVNGTSISDTTYTFTKTGQNILSYEFTAGSGCAVQKKAYVTVMPVATTVITEDTIRMYPQTGYSLNVNLVNPTPPEARYIWKQGKDTLSTYQYASLTSATKQGWWVVSGTVAGYTCVAKDSFYFQVLTRDLGVTFTQLKAQKSAKDTSKVGTNRIQNVHLIDITGKAFVPIKGEKITVSFGDQTTGVSGNDHDYNSSLVPMSYTVTVKIQLGNQSLEFSKIVTVQKGQFITTGVEEIDVENTVEIYPNPFKDFLTIEFSKPVQMVYLFDLSGKCQLAIPVAQQQRNITLQLSNLKSGTYLVSLKFTDGDVILSKKVLKQ